MLKENFSKLLYALLTSSKSPPCGEVITFFLIWWWSAPGGLFGDLPTAGERSKVDASERSNLFFTSIIEGSTGCFEDIVNRPLMLCEVTISSDVGSSNSVEIPKLPRLQRCLSSLRRAQNSVRRLDISGSVRRFRVDPVAASANFCWTQRSRSWS